MQRINYTILPWSKTPVHALASLRSCSRKLGSSGTRDPGSIDVRPC